MIVWILAHRNSKVLESTSQKIHGTNNVDMMQ